MGGGRHPYCGAVEIFGICDQRGGYSRPWRVRDSGVFSTSSCVEPGSSGTSLPPSDLKKNTAMNPMLVFVHAGDRLLYPSDPSPLTLGLCRLVMENVRLVWRKQTATTYRLRQGYFTNNGGGPVSLDATGVDSKRAANPHPSQG